MATTMRLIARVTLTGTAASVTFSSIPSSGYTDLLVLKSSRTNRTGLAVSSDSITFNTAQTHTGYSGVGLFGDGSTAYSNSGVPGSPYVGIYVGYSPGTGYTANTFSNDSIYIPNYAGSANKSISVTSVQEGNTVTCYITNVAGLWASTSAIDSVTIHCNANFGGHLFVADSSFFLYGISRA